MPLRFIEQKEGVTMEDATTLWYTSLPEKDKSIIEWFSRLDLVIRDSVIDFVVDFVDNQADLENTFNLSNHEIALLYEFCGLSLPGKWDDLFEAAGIFPTSNLIN